MQKIPDNITEPEYILCMVKILNFYIVQMTEQLQIPLFFYYALFVKPLQNVYLGNSFNIKHFIYQPRHL